MAKKPHHTLGDYVTMGLSPVLIIALITSLVFFLVEILYHGQPHEGRLRWTLFWFIFGIVWVARISMHPAVGERAGLYGILLSLAVWVGLQRFLVMDQLEGVRSGGLLPFDWAILLGFFALIWWCAYRLTWDCTFIDDDVDASGKGVFEAAGLDGEQSPKREQGPTESRANSSGSDSFGWLERYRQYREEQRNKPHTPGVWVVYFSLAALPLFGLGQALIPVEAADRRRSAFWMLGIYTASGLGLLLTTCYLGLRRYLRQRKLRMPVAMTSMWLTLGGGLIVAMLVAAALLPRPQMEYSLLRSTTQKPSDLQASPHAPLSGEPGKGEGKPGQATSADDAKTSSSHAKTKEKGGGKGKTKGSGKGEQDKGGSDKGNSKSDTGKAKTDANEKDHSSTTQPQANQDSSTQAENRPRSSSNPFEPVTSKLGGLATVLKWIVFAVLAILVLVLLLRSGLQFLANFTDWARKLLDSWRAWWEGLFGTREESGDTATASLDDAPPLRRSFNSFANPFTNGDAEQRAPEELVRYTFAALNAWAEERAAGRHPDETPREFARRLGEEQPALEEAVLRFADLYALAVYARGSLTPASLPAVRELWQRLEGRRAEVPV